MNALTIILNLLPALIAALRAVEDAIPGQGQGEAKLAAVRAIIEAVDIGVGKLWPQLASTITILVALFNATGAFNKK